MGVRPLNLVPNLRKAEPEQVDKRRGVGRQRQRTKTEGHTNPPSKSTTAPVRNPMSSSSRLETTPTKSSGEPRRPRAEPDTTESRMLSGRDSAMPARK